MIVDIYYIIDFDEGYTYYFCEGNGDTTCDRVRITEGDLKEVLREVKIALLEADVNFKIVKDFTKVVEEKALGCRKLI